MSTHDRLTIIVRAASGRAILRGKIRRISRFGVIQDYTMMLDNGQAIEISDGAVKLIALEWISQHKEQARSVLDGKEVQGDD